MDNLEKYSSVGTGVVIIGRNEGERLIRCIQSLKDDNEDAILIYVDSGSTDGSQEKMNSMNIPIFDLDLSVPFTAGRARNAGFNYLVSEYSEIEYVQFVDGDCEVHEKWLKIAQDSLLRNPSLAIVCGKCIEKHPDRSIYNRICDMEWDSPEGEVKACGGNFMVRVSAFQEVDGFNPAVIAGEEPELGFRLRQKGWKIQKIAQEMVYHDAAMTQFRQWRLRKQRGGFAYAQGYQMHGRSEEKYYLRESMRIWLWALIVPTGILLLGFLHPYFLLTFFVYPIQIVKIFVRLQERQSNKRFALFYATFIVIGKWPEFIGQLRFWKDYLLRKQHHIIEYKTRT